MMDGRFDEGFLRLMAQSEPEPDPATLRVLVITAICTALLCLALLTLG